MYSENLRSGFEGFEGFEDTNEPLPADYTGPGIWHGPEHEEFVFVVRCDGDRAVSLARAPGTTADPLSGEVVPGQFAYHLRAEVRPLSPGDPDYLKVCRLYGQDAPPRPGAVPDESLPDDLPAVPDVGELVDRLKAAAEARQARAGD